MKKFGLLCVALAIAACNNDKVIDPFSLSNYYFVRVNPQAVTLPQGGSQQLTVTPYDNSCTPTPSCDPLSPGNPISVNGIATFRLQTASDTSLVTLTPAGLVTARVTTRTTPATVNVIGSLQNIPGGQSLPSVTFADTTIVTILAAGVASPPVSNMTVTSSRATNGAGSNDTLTITYTDAAGTTLATQRGTANSCTAAGGCGTTGIGRPQFYTNDPSIATVSSTGIITGVRPGNAVITATNTVNGVSKSATFPITITDPVSATVSITTATSGNGIIFFPQVTTVSATQAAIEGRPCGPTPQPACPNPNPGAVVTFAVVGTTLFPSTFTPTTTPNDTQCFNVTFANPGAAGAAPTAPGGSTVPAGNSGNIGTGPTATNPPLCKTPTGTNAFGADAQARMFTTPGTYTFTSTTNGATGTIIVK